MTRLCLVRHGQTDWNLDGRYQGQSDVPLNKKGQAQARALARKLKGQPFTAIYASDLQRASETAEIIAASLHLAVVADPRLREIDQGKWEGQHARTIQARYARLWQRRMMNPANARPPGGETVEEVARRVYAALNDIACFHPTGPVLVISHGLALATVICKTRRLPVGQAYIVIPDNAKPLWVNWVSG